MGAPRRCSPGAGPAPRSRGSEPPGRLRKAELVGGPARPTWELLASVRRGVRCWPARPAQTGSEPRCGGRTTCPAPRAGSREAALGDGERVAGGGSGVCGHEARRLCQRPEESQDTPLSKGQVSQVHTAPHTEGQCLVGLSEVGRHRAGLPTAVVGKASDVDGTGSTSAPRPARGGCEASSAELPSSRGLAVGSTQGRADALGSLAAPKSSPVL